MFTLFINFANYILLSVFRMFNILLALCIFFIPISSLWILLYSFSAYMFSISPYKDSIYCNSGAGALLLLYIDVINTYVNQHYSIKLLNILVTLCAVKFLGKWWVREVYKHIDLLKSVPYWQHVFYYITVFYIIINFF